MQDYFNMANLQQSGQGRDSGRLPIGVVNGVPYYTMNDYQRALNAQRAQQQQIRVNNDPGLGEMNLPVQSGMDLNTVSGSQAQGMTGGTVPDYARTAMDAQRMNNMSQNSMSMGGYQEPSFVTDARQRQVMSEEAVREQRRVEDMQREQRADAAGDRARNIGTTISGVGTIQNGEVFRNDRTNFVPGMGNMNLPEQATVDPALVSQTNRNNRENPLGASPVDLYSLANDGTAEINRLQQFAGAGDAAITSTGVVDAELAAEEARAAADEEEATDAAKAAEEAAEEAAAEAEAEGEAAATAADTTLAEATQKAYQRNLTDILEAIDFRKQAAGESYSDLYQQFRDQQAFQSGITDPTGIRGGMARQDQARESAAEIGALTDLASQRERAVREVEAEKLGAESEALRMTLEQQQMEQALDPRYQNVQTINTMLQNAIEVGDEAAIARLYPELQRTLGSIAGLNQADFNFGTDAPIGEVKPQLSALAERQVQDLMKSGGLPQAVTDALASIGIGAGGVVAGATALKIAGGVGTTVAAIASKLPFVSLLTTAPGAAVAAEGIGKFGLWTAKGGKLLALTKAGAAGLAAITPAGWAVLGLAAVGSLAWYAYRQHTANLPAEEKEARIREIAEEEARVIKGQGASQEVVDAWVEEYMNTLRDGE